LINVNNAEDVMKIFPLDILMGAVLVSAVTLFLVGLYVFRGRRELPPVVLMFSSIMGFTGPVFHILNETGVISVGDPFIIAPIGIWLGGVLTSSLIWRRSG
jgi:hypothetical protein